MASAGLAALAAPKTHISGNSDSSRHLGVLADWEAAIDGHRDRVEAPEGDTEARNEAGEAGYTSVEGLKGAEFEA